jgi:signal transduction histidine kinase
VRLRAKADDRFAAITVTADAKGPEDRTTGLELDTARRLAELQGGSLSAASAPGEGTTLTLMIPLAENDEA